MKTITTIIAIAIGLAFTIFLAAQDKKPDLYDGGNISSTPQFHPPDTAVLNTSPLVILQGKIETIMTFASGGDVRLWAHGFGEFLSISGCPQGQEVYESLFPMKRPYLAPQKPEEVTITLKTADGKTWRARWEEVRDADKRSEP
jgi:hypothetical protein